MTPEMQHPHPAQGIVLDQPTTPAEPNDGRRDFDFFFGSWDIRHRKLKRRLAGCDEWDEFSGVSVAQSILGGLGNFDEIVMETPNGRALGMTLRLFEPETRLWRIYWSSSAHSTLDIPMIGRFQDGVGEFYDQELFEGRPIFSRFFWTSDGANSCHWEQAFSADGGRSWETNWTMDFTRRDAPAPTFDTHSGSSADFDFFVGEWESAQQKLKRRLANCDEWDTLTGVSHARRILGGLGHVDDVTISMPTGPVYGFTLRLYDPQTRQWSLYWASSAGQLALETPMVGSFEQGRGLFYDRETINQRSLITRFLWTSADADHCRWEQAFSPDGGQTWETNWIVDHTRRAGAQEQRHD